MTRIDRVPAWAFSVLALNVLITPVAAQTVSDAEAHVLSAFTSRADPRVLAADVKLGPTLRDQLGGETDRGRIYAALTERTAGKWLRVTTVPPAEAARYGALVDGNFSDPLLLLEAGEVALLMQYAAKGKHVALVEQVRGPAPRAEAAPAPPPPLVEIPQLPPEAPKPAPIVEVPLPAAPPPAPEPPAPPPPAVVEKPKAAPAPVVVEKPKPPAAPSVAAPKPPSPAPAAAVSPRPAQKPRGECVIKPVMSEEDLWNCSAPTRPAALDTLPPPVTVQKPSAPAAAAKAQPTLGAERRECVIKPVMSDEDLRACGAR